MAAADAFNAFNAKYLPPEKIAETFIPPHQYEVLQRVGHTMLVGPRGTGKTTLLKMLLPRALGSWRHELAAETRDRVAFTGVLISTDLTWRGQLDSTLEPGDPRRSAKSASSRSPRTFCGPSRLPLMNASTGLLATETPIAGPDRRPRRGKACACGRESVAARHGGVPARA